MTEIAAREIESWPTGAPYKLRPRMQAMTLEIILETVFGVHGGERMEALRAALRDFLDLTTDPRLLLPVLADRARPDPPHPALPPPGRPGRRADRPRDRRAPRRRGPGRARRHPLDAGRRPPRGRQPDERRRDPRRAPHPAGRRPRDDRHRPLLGDRAPDPPPARSWSACATRSLAGEEAYLTATIQETLRLRPVIVIVIRKLTEPVEIGGYELPAGASVTPSIHLVHRDPETYPNPSASCPSASSSARPAPTPGSPSAAASAAASAPPSPSSRCRSSSRAGQAPRDPPGRPEPERPFRRAITETPRHDAEVVLAELGFSQLNIRNDIYRPVGDPTRAA